MKIFFNQLTLQCFSIGITCTGLLFTANPSYGFEVTLTPAIPSEIPAKPNDIVKFIVSISKINQNLNQTVTGFHFSIDFDGNELSNIEGQNLQISETGLNYTAPTQDIKSFSFRVINPVKDGEADVWFKEKDSVKDFVIDYTDIFQRPKEQSILHRNLPQGADVVPVPEPLTLLGSASALACGILLKRKFKTS